MPGEKNQPAPSCESGTCAFAEGLTSKKGYIQAEKLPTAADRGTGGEHTDRICEGRRPPMGGDSFRLRTVPTKSLLSVLGA